MTKYFQAILYVICNTIKFTILKAFYSKKFKFQFVNFISPNSSIQLTKDSKLIFGKRLKIRSAVKIHLRNAAEVVIGDNTFINYNSMIVSHEQIHIGSNVQIGPNVLIYDHDHDFRSKGGIKDLNYKTSPVLIGNNVWIGANTIILRGSIIGDNCIIGAGSVINGKYPSNQLIVQKRETQNKDIIN